ncbi:MAG: (d)CMP kinase [Alphaproteobacteria bacterium]
MIITIDGPSGVGKGTLSKLLAAELKYARLDVGLLFRAVAFMIEDLDFFEKNSTQAKERILAMDVNAMSLNELRSEIISQRASKIATIPLVRTCLLDFQRKFMVDHKAGVILDGRDGGTVVAPWADKKIFLTASAQERAERRYKEFLEKGISTNFNDMLQNLKERDERDENRVLDPLKPAEDALILDTTGLSIDQVFKKALFFIKS